MIKFVQFFLFPLIVVLIAIGLSIFNVEGAFRSIMYILTIVILIIVGRLVYKK
ncbi:hypothetical protein ACOAKC_06480 [Hathewaya histolytica]|uniref:hypothetical protein n=1 Tax=Hathewaya histolytica TaxID=1498 RepID=UPI003B66B9B0